MHAITTVKRVEACVCVYAVSVRAQKTVDKRLRGGEEEISCSILQNMLINSI